MRLVHAAMRALAKGSRAATPTEAEAMRAWPAGEMPRMHGGDAKRERAAIAMMAGAVKQAQSGAAKLRASWRDAGKEEMARRATREGGREGARWRGVGWEAWREGLQALRAATAHRAREEAAEDDRGDADGGGDDAQPTERRHGWTMAGALIWHMQRKRAKERGAQARDGEIRAARPDAAGSGVVVFDLETTRTM